MRTVFVMINRARIYLIVVFAVTIFVPTIVVGQSSSARSRLKMRGTVIAYKTSSSFSYSSILGVSNILVIKILKIGKGKERSNYVIVRFSSGGEKYPTSEFAAYKSFDFDLRRANYCDMKLQKLMEFDMRNDKGEVTGTVPNLEIVPNIDPASLPLNETLPCYVLLP